MRESDLFSVPEILDSEGVRLLLTTNLAVKLPF